VPRESASCFPSGESTGKAFKEDLPQSGYVTQPRVAALRGYPGKRLIEVLNPETC
jgi:hypothetical protein